VYATHWICTQNNGLRAVPIVAPLQKPDYILDESRGQCQQAWRESCTLAALALQRGYLNRPELTAELFILDPFNEQTRCPVSTARATLPLAAGWQH